jgi:Opacity family porin protein
MKKNFLIVFITLMYVQIPQAQLKRFSLDFSYPYSLDSNLLKENYNGLVDVGLKYRIVKAPIINLGIAFNGSLFKANEIKTFNQENVNLNAYFVQPKLFFEFNLKQVTRLRPYFAVGYSYNIKEDIYLQPTLSTGETNVVFTIKEEGIVLNTGVSLDITSWLYIHAQYDFLRLKNINNPELETQNTNIVKAGIGFRI